MSNSELNTGSEMTPAQSAAKSVDPSESMNPGANPLDSTLRPKNIYGRTLAWIRALVAEFPHETPHEQLAILYYALTILALIGGGIWGTGKYFCCERAEAVTVHKTSSITKSPQKADVPDSTPDEDRKAQARIRELPGKLYELRSRDPRLAAEIDAAIVDLNNNKTDKAEALLRKNIEQSPVGDQNNRKQNAEFHLYLAVIVFVQSKGDALRELQSAVEVDPENCEAWSDYGDVALAAGETAKADHASREALRLARLQQNIALEARSLIIFGNVLAKLGNYPAAVLAYDRASKLYEGESRRDPSKSEWQFNLAISYYQIGKILQENGDHDGAFKAYQEGLKIIDDLTKIDPANFEWQFNLSIGYDGIGSVMQKKGNRDEALKAYQENFRIIEDLTKRKPLNAEWRHALSTSYVRKGSILQENGDHDGALKAYQEGLKIRKSLVETDPSNAEWRLDLSVSYEGIGSIRQEDGNRDGALESYLHGLQIRKELADRNPEMVSWQFNYAKSLWEVASLSFDQCTNLEKIVMVLEPLEQKHALTVEQRKSLSLQQAKDKFLHTKCTK